MRRHGFTLIELLVVVMIIAVLTAIALPQYRRAMMRSRTAEAMQMLPAIFEARERWMIEHGCTWDDSTNGYTCDDNQTISFPKLDIEMKGGLDSNFTNNRVWKTKNFQYHLLTNSAVELPANGDKQRCVKAVPLFSMGNHQMAKASIYYRGDKFSCNNGDGTGEPCAILNVDSGDGTGQCE